MRLAIDASEEPYIIFHYFHSGQWGTEKFEDQGEGALLRSLLALLERQKFSLADIKGLAVRVGKGKFTSTRVAVTVANTLAFTNQLPIIPYHEFNEVALENAWREAVPGTYISAEYSAAPRIGQTT